MSKNEKNTFDGTNVFGEKFNSSFENCFKEVKNLEEQIRLDERKKVFLEVTNAINGSSGLISYIEIFETMFNMKCNDENEKKIFGKESI